MALVGNLQEFFQKWGRRGGRARAARLSALERRRIARKGARARWDRRDDAFYNFPAGRDLGEIAPAIVGGSMTAVAIRQSIKLL